MKILCFAALSAAALIFLAGCAGETEKVQPASRPDPAVDITYIEEKGSMVFGVTDIAPLDHKDADSGEWKGFDAELASLFAKRMGAKAEFREIDWDEKISLMNSGEIDVIWNGMTRTDETEENLTCSVPYLSNSQVIVMPEKEFERYRSEEDCSHLLFSFEKGSAAEAVLAENKYRSVGYVTQKEALSAVKNGKTDAAVIDMVAAAFLTADGEEYSELGYAYPLNEEYICVGLRKGSELERPLNTFLKDISDDGTMKKIAEKYGLAEALLEIE